MSLNMNWFVDCPFKGQCKSFPWKCHECRNSKNDEDHFEPKPNKVTWETHRAPSSPPPMRC